MEISQLVSGEITQQLERCQSDLDSLSEIIWMLQELLLRRQEDQDKLVQAFQLLQCRSQIKPWDTSSLILLEMEDYE